MWHESGRFPQPPVPLFLLSLLVPSLGSPFSSIRLGLPFTVRAGTLSPYRRRYGSWLHRHPCIFLCLHVMFSVDGQSGQNKSAQTFFHIIILIDLSLINSIKPFTFSIQILGSHNVGSWIKICNTLYVMLCYVTLPLLGMSFSSVKHFPISIISQNPMLLCFIWLSSTHLEKKNGKG